MAQRRVGVFGGTFDPVHIGHLVAAVNARHACGLDEVLMVVANEPWQKVGQQAITPAERRFVALAAAVEGHEGLVASRLEIDRGGRTYTVDTLRQLSAPDTDLSLVLGADAASRLPTWREADAVAELADVIVVNRPGAEVPSLPAPWRLYRVEIPSLDVSSTDLRERLRDGRPLDFLMPDRAAEIFRHPS